MGRSAALEADAPAAGKTHRDEDFPVASLFIAKPLRGAVLAFYRYVRAADDVADDGRLSPDEKLGRLDAMERALLDEGTHDPLASALRRADAKHGAGIAEGRLLLDAFRQDAAKTRYADWAELMDYCRRSADPVGRFLLRLHGEDEAAFPAADALCSALQILNHLQDLGKDRADLGRVYLPEPWMALAGGEEAFFDPANGARRRAVLDAALDRVDQFVDAACDLPMMLASPRLAAQSAMTIATAERLAQKLRRADPITARVRLGKADFAAAFAAALAGLPRRRRDPAPGVTARIVRGSGSSFRLGMASLDGERRRAIHALYAYCRVIDDIADGLAPAPEKRAFLDAWRREIEALPHAPASPLGRELARAMRAHDLPPEEFHALLDGMETDACERLRIPDMEAFDLYCRRVAGAVGALSIRIFGAPEAEDFALTLGRALQIVNVLRDIDDDAAMERVYLPLDRLAALGIADGPAAAMVADPRFAQACDALAQEAKDDFARVDAMLARLDRRRLKPAILMMGGYRAIFDRLLARGFEERGPRMRLGLREKAALALASLRWAP
ncbi:MAG: hypothetical protein EA385_02905 [Salinarimonadaceae bacterium]|nr:MAG: hypothetical protein EA385_02905 [Salinarimonadaceae bacterium]